MSSILLSAVFFTKGGNMTSCRGIAIYVLALAVAGCEAATPASTEPPGAEVSALLEQSPDRTVVVIARTRDAAQLQRAARGERTGFQWITVDIPSHALPLGSGSFDLSRAENDVIFAQNYYDTCNPAAVEISRCWLQERYRAGDAGLQGMVALHKSADGLKAELAVDWQGITDRFGDKQWHRHITNSQYAIVSRNLIETSK